jgi:phospholipid/cholesterol/gamma-HCH transport system ATP-binding protein
MVSMASQSKQPAASTDPLVELRSVDVEFGRNPVLRAIDLAIPRGQTLAIIGESGCGKTVILKTIIGLVRPSRGEVLFDGKDLADLSEQELTAERIRFGFVFQGAALFDSMTVGQNVAFPLREHTRNSDQQMQEAVLSRLAEVGLP